MSTSPGALSPEGQPVGWINLTVQGSLLTASFVDPTVRLNGYPVAVHRGQNVLPVWPGRNVLDVEMHWMWTYGRASLPVDVPSGQTVPVFYVAPYSTFAQGAIGTVPQHRADRWVYWGTLALVVVAMVAGFLAFTALG